MTPRDFLDTVVRPNYAELCADYANLKCAFNAVASVDALAAHLYFHLQAIGHVDVSSTDDDSRFRHDLSGLFPDFGLIRDVAKAHKHVRLVRGNPLVTGADQTKVKSLGWGEARWGEGRWGSPPQAVVETNNGDFRVVEALVKGSIEFLEGRLSSYGL